MRSLSCSAAVLLVFAAPVSRSLFTIAALLVLIGFMFSGDWLRKWSAITRHEIFRPVVFLVMLIVAGVTYSSGAAADVLKHVTVYSTFILSLILLWAFKERVWQERAWKAFAIAVWLMMLSSLAGVWWSLPWAKTQVTGFGVDHSVFSDYIIEGLITNLFLLRSLQQAHLSAARRIFFFWIFSAAFAGFSLIFLLQGRTGLVTMAVTVAVYAATVVRPAYRWLAIAGVTLAVAVGAWLSPLAQARIALGLAEVSSYNYVDDGSSLGARLHMWYSSVGFLKASPLFGHGTGSYPTLAQGHFVNCLQSCVHPHNQFLFFGVDHGIIGIAAYIWLIYSMVRSGTLSSPSGRPLTNGFVALLIVDSLINAPLWTTMERHFFFATFPLIFAGRYSVARSTTKSSSAIP